MNEREWSKFFELMKQITDLPMAVDEKARMVAQEAKDRG
jgi:hypothetical protein